MSDNISSFKFFKETFILNMLFRSFCLFSAKNGQRKKRWSVVSVSEPQPDIGLGVSWNYDEIYDRLNDWVLTVALIIT